MNFIVCKLKKLKIETNYINESLYSLIAFLSLILSPSKGTNLLFVTQILCITSKFKNITYFDKHKQRIELILEETKKLENESLLCIYS